MGDLRLLSFLSILHVGSLTTAQGAPQSDGSWSKRWGDSLVSQGLPLWLEKRGLDYWDLSERDAPSGEMYGGSVDGPSPTEAAIAQNLRDREQTQVNALLRSLRGESVPYEDSRAIIIDDSLQIPTRSVRSSKPSPSSSWYSLQGPLKWQPIVIGAGACMFVVLAILGSTLYYRRVHLPKQRANGHHGSGDLFGPLGHNKNSPTGSLLGDATVISVEGDRKLAHSAQMYHYQHQKQQMLAVEKASDHAHVSETNSESDPEDADFTVYECPGFTENGKLEVDNPLYEGEGSNGANGGSGKNGTYGEVIGDSEVEDADTPTEKQSKETL